MISRITQLAMVSDTEFQVSRSATSMGFHSPIRRGTFYLPPEVSSRSLSAALPCAGWRDAPYPQHHRGLLGAFVDFWAAVYHETPIIAPLLKKLVGFLGVGVKAYFMFFRLVLFATAISPVVAKAGLWWWNSETISRGVKYGKNPRNFLDIYHVTNNERVIEPEDQIRYPVVVYVTGGAWIIGYKAWAVSLGEYLGNHGVMMVALDYRNFPQGTLKDMVEDVNTGLDWVWNNIENFGGDKTRIFIVGQSAGAQILATILLQKASSNSSSLENSMPLSAWKKFIGTSGPYDIVSLAPLVHKRGLYLSMLKAIMDNDLFAASPTRVLSSLKPEAVSRFPPILLFHGTNDATVPHSMSVEFFDALKRTGIKNIQLELWPGISHSEPLVEGPAGGNNFFGSRLVCEALGENGTLISEPLMHDFMIRFAKFIMPF